MRKLVYHIATTLDNFICHEDGSVDGFVDGDHVPEYLETLKKYDTVVMGRATYEFGYRYGMKPGDAPYPHMDHYIFSKSLQFDQPASPNVHIIRSEPGEFVKGLKEQQGTDIYLCGGAKFAKSLFEQKLIDQLIIKLNPIILGKGMRLFADSTLSAQLHLLSSKAYASGVVLLTYDLKY